MPDWLRCADLVVTKAGPGTIAEAASCGAPLLLTSHLPGQEQGNTELVTGAGASRCATGVRRLIDGRPAAGRPAAPRLDADRVGRLGSPAAAAHIAALIADLAEPTHRPPPRPPDGQRTESLAEAGHGAA